MSSHLAVYRAEKLEKQKKIIIEMRHAFLGNSQERVSVRPIVYDSWVRCLRAGIDPGLKQTKSPQRENFFLEGVSEYSELYEYAVPVIEELYAEIQNTHHILTLCNNQGRIIYLNGDQQVRTQAEKINFIPGTDWSEGIIGTNAIGTCLATGKAVQIFAAEHFCEGIQDWVCSAAPIIDPMTQKIIGVLDITGGWKDAQTHTLGMAAMAAKVVEYKLLENATNIKNKLMKQCLAIMNRYPHDGVIVLGRSFNLMKANALARRFFQNIAGKDLSMLWVEHKIYTQLLSQYNSAQPQQEYQFFIEQFGIPVSIQKIYDSDIHLGFVLILKPSDRKIFSETPLGSTFSGGIIGNSDSILSAMTKCNTVANTDVSVLLLGESGSGKELFARAIHQISNRRTEPFIAVNCGAVPKDLLASELFGYEPGSFTGAVKNGKKGKFEEAHGGTLFLDEVGDMPFDFQIQLLRVLQEKEVVRLGSSKSIPVDVRIIAATHRNLDQLVHDGLFRADLYYRLNVVSIKVPSLKERRDDIPLLLDHFVNLFSQKHNRPPLMFDPQVKDFLINIYQWPGNVRELQNSIENVVLLCHSGIVLTGDLPQRIRIAIEERQDNKKEDLLENNKKFPDCEELLSMLQDSGGNLSAVSRQLGVARTTLYRHMNKCGISKMLFKINA